MKNKYIKKNVFFIVNFILFLLEILMIYLIIKSILTKDLIRPNEIAFYEYIRVKLSNLL